MDEVSNPWVSRSSVPAPVPQSAAASWILAPTGPTAPQLGVPAPPADRRLPVVRVDDTAALWVVGVHGGSGESTFASLVEGARGGGHAWPRGDASPSPVVLVCRTNARGLQAARDAAQQWASGQVPNVNLLGLVLFADSPGKLPRLLRDRIQVVRGGVPRTWNVPWVESWRSVDADVATAPREVRRVIDELSALISNPKERTSQ